VLFKTVLLDTTPRDSMKRTAKPGLPAGWQAGLGQGLESDEYILVGNKAKTVNPWPRPDWSGYCSS